MYYRSAQLKGKELPTPIYLPYLDLSHLESEPWYDPFPDIKPRLHPMQLDWLTK